MQFLIYLSNFMIPIIIFYILVTGLLEKRPVYDDFVHGAKDGIKTVFSILPTLIGLMVGVGVLRSSGFLDFIADLLSKPAQCLGFPAPLVPLSIVRMFSSSAATGLVLDLFSQYGTDSLIGTIASISMSCTETIFYTMSVYFMAAKVTKTRYTLAGALLSTLAGLIASTILGHLLVP